MNAELAGTLKNRARIERRVGNRGALAGAVGKYVYAGDCWVSLTPIAPGPQESAEALSAMPRWRVSLRKREGIDLETRLVWKGRYLAVRAVQSDPRDPSQLMLTCEEAR